MAQSGTTFNLLWLLMLFQTGCLSERFRYFDGEITNLDGSGRSLSGKTDIGSLFGNQVYDHGYVHGIGLSGSYLVLVNGPSDIPRKWVRNETLKEAWLVTGTAVAGLHGDKSFEFTQAFAAATPTEREAMPGFYRLSGAIDVTHFDDDRLDVVVDLTTDVEPRLSLRGRFRSYDRLQFRPMRWLAYVFMSLT
jgi:hypothetical protein